MCIVSLRHSGVHVQENRYNWWEADGANTNHWGLEYWCLSTTPLSFYCLQATFLKLFITSFLTHAFFCCLEHLVKHESCFWAPKNWSLILLKMVELQPNWRSVSGMKAIHSLGCMLRNMIGSVCHVTFCFYFYDDRKRVIRISKRGKLLVDI